MDIAVETLQAFLDYAWDNTTADSGSLRPQFRSYENQLLALFAGSGVVGSVAKNSASQSYRGPGLGSYTVAQLQTAWRMLINVYDEVKKRTDWLFYMAVQYPASPEGQCFITKYPTYGADPDPAVYDGMVCKLEPVDSYEIDLTDLRLQPTLNGPPFNPPFAW